MKFTMPCTKEIDIKYLKVILPIRYEEEDIPNDFPLRIGDTWTAEINMDTGIIKNWPIGKHGKIDYMKVCDEGTYILIDEHGGIVKEIRRDYVPNKLLPPNDGYGDYVTLDIDVNGKILNWYSSPSLSNFYPGIES